MNCPHCGAKPGEQDNLHDWGMFCCQRSRSGFVRGRFFIDPDYHPNSTNRNCRLMGTFDTGVESLLAVPVSKKSNSQPHIYAWGGAKNTDPWNLFLTCEEAEAWIICLDKWDNEGLIDWSGDYPLMKGW